MMGYIIKMQRHILLLIAIKSTVLVFISARIDFIVPPKQLTTCFDQKRAQINNSSITDSAQGWCIQKFRWHLATSLWHNISSETKQWVNELLRIAEEQEKRPKRQARHLRVRKEYRRLTDQERYNYHRAIQLLKGDTSISPNRYDALAYIHQRLGDDIHHGAAFLGWHRVMLIIYENALRQKIPTVVLPYWDSRLDAELTFPDQSIIWTDRFVGNGYGRVVTGPFRNWNTPSAALVRNLGQEGELFSRRQLQAVFTRNRLVDISEPNAYPPFDFEIRHGEVHKWVGGQMAPAETSAYDPLFYLHHTFVDYMWELFRMQQRRRGVDPTTDYPQSYGPASHAPTASMGFGRLQNIHGLSDVYTSQIYTYENSPTCSYGWPFCGSQYIRCELRYSEPTCVSATAFNFRLTNPPRRHSTPNRNGFPVHFFTRKKRDLKKALSTFKKMKYFTKKGDVCPIKEQPHVIQNIFQLNGIVDTRVWVYVPVQIVSKRVHRSFKFNSYPMKKGKIVDEYDIYNPKQYESLKYYFNITSQGKKECKRNEGIINRVVVTSNGLNYHGNYREFAMLDGRQPFTSTVVYMAVKSPEKQVTNVLFTAHDACGNVCEAYCRRGRHYKPCQGALQITSKAPKQYGTDYGDAVRIVWDISRGFPMMRQHRLQIQFVCN